MNIDKLKDIYKHSKNYNISFSRDSLFELIENIESIARNAQIESEINESYYKENKKYKEVFDKINVLLNNHDKNMGKLYYKYNNKYLLSEIKEGIRDILKEVKHD